MIAKQRRRRGGGEDKGGESEKSNLTQAHPKQERDKGGGGARTGREDGNSPYNDPLGRTAGYSAALSSPPNKTTVRAFLMARSTPPRNAPSMRANATSRPEGSTTAMLSLICWAEAAATAALRTEVANASEMLWWISGAGLVALLGWQEGVVVACKGQVRSERRRRRRIRRGRVEEG